MRFFDEAKSVLQWIKEKNDAFSKIRSNGGVLDMLIGLPGSRYIMSALPFEAAHLALELDVSIHVEVFPELVFENMDLSAASFPMKNASD